MVADKKTYQNLVADAKFSYDELCLERDKLAGQKKSINPLKLFAKYRSTRLLLEAGTQLYQNTKTTSEKMRRRAASINSTYAEHVQPEDDNLSSDTIDGLVFESALDESMSALVTDAVSFIASHVDLLPEGFADDHEVDDARVNVGTEWVGSRINVALEDNSTPSSSTDNTDRASSISTNSFFSYTSTLVGSLES